MTAGKTANHQRHRQLYKRLAYLSLVLKSQAMTKEQWQEVKDNWGAQFTSQRFKVDGYDVTLQTERSGMKLFETIYVNGEICGKDLLDASEDKITEIARRFYFKKSKRVYSDKYIKDMEKIFGKKRAKERGYTKDAKIYYVTPHYTSFATFKKQIINNNQSIELINK